MSTKKDFLDYIVYDVMQGIQGITARAMFGGHGLYKQGVFFGIIFDNTLYFKVDEKSLPDYQARGSKPFIYKRKNHKKTTLGYWEVPAEVQEDREQLEDWIDRSIAKENIK